MGLNWDYILEVHYLCDKINCHDHKFPNKEIRKKIRL